MKHNYHVMLDLNKMLVAGAIVTIQLEDLSSPSIHCLKKVEMADIPSKVSCLTIVDIEDDELGFLETLIIHSMIAVHLFQLVQN